MRITNVQGAALSAREVTGRRIKDPLTHRTQLTAAHEARRCKQRVFRAPLIRRSAPCWYAVAGLSEVGGQLGGAPLIFSGPGIIESIPLNSLPL
jgi:hypothetical protein